MNLLPKYYYRKYIDKVLKFRISHPDENINVIAIDVNNNVRLKSLLNVINETYESATNGFFASSGNILQ